MKTEEMLTGWDLDKKYKYLCFYHKALPFMIDSWGMDCSDSKEELLAKQYPLFSPGDIFEQSTFDETFRLVFDVMATDPQILLCSEGEYRMHRTEEGYFVFDDQGNFTDQFLEKFG